MAVSDAELVAHLVECSQVSLLVQHGRPAHRGGKRASADHAGVESTAATQGKACLRGRLDRAMVVILNSPGKSAAGTVIELSVHCL